MSTLAVQAASRTAAPVTGRGTPQFMIIQGAPRSGKSALLSQAASAARDAGSLVLRAGASALEEDFPLGVVSQLFELLLDGAPAGDRRTWLRGPAGLVPRILGLETPAAGQAGPDGQDLTGHAASHAVFWLTANIARHTPLVILLDDLQWADAASLHWLIHLVRRMADLPVTIIAALDGSVTAASPRLVEMLRAETASLSLPKDAERADRLVTGRPVPVFAGDRAPAEPHRQAAYGPGALTPHDHRLITMAIDGQTNGQIAERFGVSRRAVEFHFTHIYRKLGIARRPQLHRFAQLALSGGSAVQEPDEPLGPPHVGRAAPE
jgi:DNA-binding NarL/FixJ family response regulator